MTRRDRWPRVPTNFARVLLTASTLSLLAACGETTGPELRREAPEDSHGEDLAGLGPEELAEQGPDRTLGPAGTLEPNGTLEDPLRTAPEPNPGSVEARFEEGRALHRLGRIRDALASLRAALELDADHGPAHVRMAVLLHQTGDRQGARRHLERARRAGARVPAALSVLLGEIEAPPLRLRTGVPAGSSAEAPSLSPARRIDRAPDGAQAAETSLTASPAGEIVAAWMDTRDAGENGEWRIVSAVSPDGGATWTEQTVRPSNPRVFSFEGDPTTAYDPRSGSFWVGGAVFVRGNVYAARKDPGSDTFLPGVLLRNGEKFSDKPYLAAGPHPDDPRETRLYMVDYRGLQISDDLGDTWTDLVELEGNPVGALPRIGPDGELYITALPGLEREDYVVYRSFDGGVTVEEPSVIALRMDTWEFQDGSRFPGRFRVAPLPFCAVDRRDATLYCVYFDTVAAVEGASQGPGGTDFDVDLFFTRSTDRGETWTPPRRIPTGGDGRGDSFFPWLEVDSTGRLHMLFYDTRRDPRTDAAANAAIDVFYAWSEDRGESWTEIRLTEEPFETEGIVWTDMEEFLGDYLGLAVAGPKAHLLYPLADEGDLNIYFQTVDFSGVPPSPGGPCVPGPRTLCLLDGRFEVRVRWRDPFNGGDGPGRAVPFEFRDGSTSNNTGTFWFFDPANVELVVKALDARSVNGFFWVFYGALSHVEYWVTVTDLQAGTSTTYHNPPGKLCGFGDTRAFPRPGTSEGGSELSGFSVEPDRSNPDPSPGIPGELRTTSSSGAAGCRESDTVLCLQEGRFRVEVEWEDPRGGDTGVGGALPGTDDSGFFWFFDPENVELVVKLLDARPVNGRYWFFFGGLSDVRYTVTVTDTREDISRVYRSEAFEICGGADTAAF